MPPIQTVTTGFKELLFLLFKDWKTILFHTSELNGTVSYDITKDNNTMAIFVYGLIPFKQRDNGSMGIMNTLVTPRLVVEYNLYTSCQ